MPIDGAYPILNGLAASADNPVRLLALSSAGAAKRAAPAARDVVMKLRLDFVLFIAF